MDIGMPRLDYDRFLRIFPSQGIRTAVLKTHERSPRDHVYQWAKLEDNATKIMVEWFEHLNPEIGVFIDIFPIDGAPASPPKQLKHVHKIEMLKVIYTGSFKPAVKNFLIRRIVWK